jgi:hypothetical protein
LASRFRTVCVADASAAGSVGFQDDGGNTGGLTGRANDGRDVVDAVRPQVAAFQHEACKGNDSDGTGLPPVERVANIGFLFGKPPSPSPVSPAMGFLKII